MCCWDIDLEVKKQNKPKQGRLTTFKSTCIDVKSSHDLKQNEHKQKSRINLENKSCVQDLNPSTPHNWF